MSDPFIDSMEYRDPASWESPAEPTQAERLSKPKSYMWTPAERLEQLVQSTLTTYYHIHMCQQIHERLGPGDPMENMLIDEKLHQLFDLKPRMWGKS